MKIGVITTSYPRHEGDHAGNFVGAHVAALRAAGHDVDVIGAHTIASSLFDTGGAPDALERGGLRTYLAAARFSAQLTWHARAQIARWDVVIAHWLVPSALAAVIARVGGRSRPLLAIAHGGDLHTLRRLHLLAPALHTLHRAGACLAFVSDELRTLARTAAPRLDAYLAGALVQPMGIDVGHFAGLQRRAPTTPPTVAIVSRLVPVKGVDVALAAFARVRTPVRLVIAGDGPERTRLEELARRLRVTATFVGRVDARGRDELLRDASCVVIPSRILASGRSEGTPMIALEALAAGVPVVASAVGGLRELPGVTRVRAEDPAALAAAIDHVLGRSLAPESTAVRTDMSAFDWPTVSERLLAHVLGAAREPGRNDTDRPRCEADDSNRRRTA